MALVRLGPDEIKFAHFYSLQEEDSEPELVQLVISIIPIGPSQ